MATVIGAIASPVESGHYNEQSGVSGGTNPGTKTKSCFGLPGQGTLKGAYLYFNATINVVVLDNEDVLAFLGGGWVGNGNITGSSFPSRLYVKPYWFEITDPFNSTDQIFSFELTKKSSASGVIRYNFPNAALPAVGATSWDSRYVKIGTLSDFAVPGTGVDGYGYIAGCAYYDIDDPVYPEAEDFKIPNFLRYLKYFPWAVRQDGVWKSCNREGGGLFVRKDGVWVECKNSESDSEEQNAFYRSNGSWVKSPKLGEGA